MFSLVPLCTKTGLVMTSLFAYGIQAVLVAGLLTETPMTRQVLEEKLGSETLSYVAPALPSG